MRSTQAVGCVCASVSDDNGITWPRRLDLEAGDGEYSYPSVIQAVDGRVHIVATRLRQQIFQYVLTSEEC